MARRKRDDLGEIPQSPELASNLPELYPEAIIPPEAPTGLDPSDTPIVSDSPRRALSPGRFGNPMKEKMAAQPENSDSPADDEPMESRDERAVADADLSDE